MKRGRYIYEILRCLDNHKGSAQLTPTVYYDEVFDAIRASLIDEDLALIPHGIEPRWRNHIRQASRTMVEHGLMKRTILDTWDIANEGRVRERWRHYFLDL
jgi:hypothetical protein